MRLELDKVLSNDICHGLMYNLEIEIVYLFTRSDIGRFRGMKNIRIFKFISIYYLTYFFFILKQYIHSYYNM